MWPCRGAGIIISPSARNLTVGAVADADTKQEAASKGESGGSKSVHFVAQVPSHHRWPLTLGLWAIGHVELRLESLADAPWRAVPARLPLALSTRTRTTQTHRPAPARPTAKEIGRSTTQRCMGRRTRWSCCCVCGQIHHLINISGWGITRTPHIPDSSISLLCPITARAPVISMHATTPEMDRRLIS